MSALLPKADIGHASLASGLSESPDRIATIRLERKSRKSGPVHTGSAYAW
jgi:hypothetical protein